MGDRANVKFIDGDTFVNVYTHWHGTELAVQAHQELGSAPARARWGDPEYVTRIVVQRVLNALADPDEETGFGLGAMDGDNEHQILELNVADSTVSLGVWSGTFEQFCALPPEIVRAMAD
jgi:hypothetical protein